MKKIRSVEEVVQGFLQIPVVVQKCLRRYLKRDYYYGLCNTMKNLIDVSDEK